MDDVFKLLGSSKDLGILNGLAFEEYLRQLFVDLGYLVQKTSATGDYGADLVLRKDGKSVAVQAKQHSAPVGFDAVKEVSFARTFYGTDDAWVIITSTFTAQAKAAAEKAGVFLIDGARLDTLIRDAQTARETTESVRESQASDQLEVVAVAPEEPSEERERKGIDGDQAEDVRAPYGDVPPFLLQGASLRDVSSLSCTEIEDAVVWAYGDLGFRVMRATGSAVPGCLVFRASRPSSARLSYTTRTRGSSFPIVPSAERWGCLPKASGFESLGHGNSIGSSGRDVKRTEGSCAPTTTQTNKQMLTLPWRTPTNTAQYRLASCKKPSSSSFCAWHSRT